MYGLPLYARWRYEEEDHMSDLIPGNNKHLSLKDRQYIEASLNENKSFREISRYLCKDPTTISKEVKLNRTQNTWNKGSFTNPHNFCVHRYHCKKKNVCNKIIICDYYCRSCIKCNNVCDHFEQEKCNRITRAPFVCNSCNKPRNKCTIETKFNYDAKAAQRYYEERLSGSREGINMTRTELHEMDKVVRPLITQGQSPYMIVTNHPELDISVKTLYNYIDDGYLLSRNIDLKRKPKFKPRKCHKTQIHNREAFIGRTYNDFKKLNLKEVDFVEMDTVISARGSNKCILTFYFPAFELFDAYLMNRCTPGAVKLIFDRLQTSLGGAYEFQEMFPVILTDRGKEFGDPDSLETDKEGTIRTSIYYCDPMRSCQKAGIENVHTMLRMILPKGTCFENLTQHDIRKCVDHINNAPRNNLYDMTPYKAALDYYDEDVMKKMQLRYVEPDKVMLSPKLLNL